jgi:hypothetical protein
VHFVFVQTARETAGAARTLSSLRPLICEGEEFQQTSGASRRGIANTYSIVIARHRVGRMAAR